MDQRVQQVISFIKHNFRYRLSLEEMARQAELTPWDLYRLFKSATGLSPGHYLTAQRMEEAKLLLAVTCLSSREIMLRIGVNDENQFNQDFIGSAPTAILTVAVHSSMAFKRKIFTAKKRMNILAASLHCPPTW